MPTDHVTRAVDALRHLGTDNRDDARRLLGMYTGRHELTAAQVAQVLNEFPARHAVTRDPR